MAISGRDLSVDIWKSGWDWVLMSQAAVKGS